MSWSDKSHFSPPIMKVLETEFSFSLYPLMHLVSPILSYFQVSPWDKVSNCFPSLLLPSLWPTKTHLFITYPPVFFLFPSVISIWFLKYRNWYTFLGFWFKLQKTHEDDRCRKWIHNLYSDRLITDLWEIEIRFLHICPQRGVTQNYCHQPGPCLQV